ncbi:MAG: folate family ECF transporter S component [Candidatus Pelethousia sp.]|nr:folate family ECF transporter S component [Candidatus Pelethousia sp.]
MEQNTKQTNVRPATRKLANCALLAAMGAVLGIVSIPLPAVSAGGYSLKIGITVLPVILAAVLYGPAYGGMVGTITDLLPALLFPKGPFVPWFTLIGALFGVLPGLYFAKGQAPTPKRLLLAVATGQLVCSVLLNTLLLTTLYGLPYQIVYVRLLNQAIMIPVYTIITYYVVKLLKKGDVI